MQLFGKKSKTPQEIVKAIKEKLPKLAQLMVNAGNSGCSSSNVGGTVSSNLSSPSGSSIVITSTGEPGIMSGSGTGGGNSSTSTTGITTIGNLIGLTTNPTSPGVDKKSIEKLQEEISKNLSSMKAILYGDKGKGKKITQS